MVIPGVEGSIGGLIGSLDPEGGALVAVKANGAGARERAEVGALAADWHAIGVKHEELAGGPVRGAVGVGNAGPAEERSRNEAGDLTGGHKRK